MGLKARESTLLYFSYKLMTYLLSKWHMQCDLRSFIYDVYKWAKTDPFSCLLLCALDQHPTLRTSTNGIITTLHKLTAAGTQYVCSQSPSSFVQVQVKVTHHGFITEFKYNLWCNYFSALYYLQDISMSLHLWPLIVTQSHYITLGTLYP